MGRKSRKMGNVGNRCLMYLCCINSSLTERSTASRTAVQARREAPVCGPKGSIEFVTVGHL